MPCIAPANGTSSLTYSFIGSGDAEGINRRASLKMTAQNATFITPFGDPSIYEQMNDGYDNPDGQNQYNYSFETPGVLELNLKIKIEPANYASNIVEQCLFTVGDIGNSVKEWAAINPGGKPIVSNDCLIATVKFTGLPKHNNDFGWKTAALKYNRQSIAENRYGVFFPNHDANHPYCDTCEGCPNWFFYWREGGVCGIPKTNCVFDLATGLAGYVEPWNDSIIRIGWRAAGQSEPEIFTNKTTHTTIAVQRAGKDIYRIPGVARHEQCHLIIYELFKHLRFSATAWDADNMPIHLLNPADDLDDDWIPNTAEETCMGVETDSNESDTYQLHLHFEGQNIMRRGDTEIRCILQEDAPTTLVYPEKDWAYPGRQHIMYIKQEKENNEN